MTGGTKAVISIQNGSTLATNGPVNRPTMVGNEGWQRGFAGVLGPAVVGGLVRLAHGGRSITDHIAAADYFVLLHKPASANRVRIG
jgi:hypothetical protein